MPVENVTTDQTIVSLLEATDALLRGDYNRGLVSIDAENLLSDLAIKINKMMINMKSVEKTLAEAGHQAPNTVIRAEGVLDLMSQSTNDVLNKSDGLIEHLNKLESHLSAGNGNEQLAMKQFKDALPLMKSMLFDVIASQSYQDAARQKMEKLIQDLTQIRDWLINVLVILNIKHDASSENLEKKVNVLREVKEAGSEDLKQDLIDDLLAEFGF
jgi:chemotaxis regulatin CheY-phosphate phosphatase CheZ